MSGQTEKVITETIKNGQKDVFVTSITKITSTWDSIGLFNKKLLLAYALMGCVYTTYESYNEGKARLLEYRAGRNLDSKINTEWDAVKRGCSVGAWNGVFGAIVWPLRIGSSIMPHLILKLNPPPEKSKNNSSEK